MNAILKSKRLDYYTNQEQEDQGEEHRIVDTDEENDYWTGFLAAVLMRESQSYRMRAELRESPIEPKHSKSHSFLRTRREMNWALWAPWKLKQKTNELHGPGCMKARGDVPHALVHSDPKEARVIELLFKLRKSPSPIAGEQDWDDLRPVGSDRIGTGKSFLSRSIFFFFYCSSPASPLFEWWAGEMRLRLDLLLLTAALLFSPAPSDLVLSKVDRRVSSSLNLLSSSLMQVQFLLNVVHSKPPLRF